jgi:D-alanine-D-alanine ligase
MNPADYGKVAVLMGGPSAERAVSLKGGTAVLAALKRRGVDAHGVDADRAVLRRLEDGGFDRAFIMLHGPWGEDGVIQGALEVLGLPYTGSGVLASALGMDKLRCKQLFAAAGVPTADFLELRPGTTATEAIRRLGTPLAIKPNAQGSSVGVSKVFAPDEFEAAWAEARRYDPCVLAERWVEGREVTAAVLGREVLPLIEVETPHGFYDYDAKYHADDTRYHCPAELTTEVAARTRQLARAVFDLLGCRGWGRVDFIVDRAGEPWVLEINTVPGMTDHSLVPMAARAVGIEFDELVLRILDTSFPAVSSGGHHGAG